MGILQKVLKMIASLMIGISAGLIISGLAIVLFTDTSLTEFISKFKSIEFKEVVFAALIGIMSFVVSLFILITAHEAGHLVCGLLTGYKYVSFRIFNFTLIRNNNDRPCVKKFSVKGTGGQCLLSPPDLPLDKIPTAWYNAGGILANLLLLVVFIPLLWLDLNTFFTEFIVIFIFTDAIMLLMNAIPMQAGGIGNDAYNMIHLRHSMLSKHAIVLQLKSNALIQQGIRPKDMPDEWFEWREDICWKNALEISIPLMHASRLVDMMNWERAYDEFESLYRHKDDIMQLYVNEIACELICCALVTGRRERGADLLDGNLQKYISSYKKVMSSKQRVLCAIALYIENDINKATEIFRSLEASQSKYLLQGEVKSDLAIMKTMLDDFFEKKA